MTRWAGRPSMKTLPDTSCRSGPPPPHPAVNSTAQHRTGRLHPFRRKFPVNTDSAFLWPNRDFPEPIAKNRHCITRTQRHISCSDDKPSPIRVRFYVHMQRKCNRVVGRTQKKSGCVKSVTVGAWYQCEPELKLVPSSSDAVGVVEHPQHCFSVGTQA
jgi:hypothetical protein